MGFYGNWYVFSSSHNDTIWLRLHAGGRCGRDCMTVGIITTCTINAYNHKSCEFEPRSWRVVLGTILCDKVWQWLLTGRLFSPDTPVSSSNKTDRHDIAEILLKVTLNTINKTSPNQTTCNKSTSVSCFLINYQDEVRVYKTRLTPQLLFMEVSVLRQ